MQHLSRVAPVLDDLAARLGSTGHALAVVGGSVRDALLGRLGVDLDFATDARPEEVLAAVAGWGTTWTTGIEFGTVGIQRGDLRLEVTTYRAEAYDAQTRKPQVRYGDSLEEDLLRRDFAVNAMAVPLPFSAAAPLVDPFGGLEDLGRRLLRTPGRPEDSFSDDPLRMLRAARFSAQLGFDVDPDAVRVMAEKAERIDIVSAERIRDELAKLLLAPHPRRGLTLLVDTGLAGRVLPELPRLKETVDEHHRHKDVYEHTLTVLDQAIAQESRLPGGGPDLVLRIAALLHDIGKPDTRDFGPDGGVSFHHHELVGARMARKRLAALRFPKQVVEDVALLVALHLRFHGYGEGEWTDSAVRRYVRDAGEQLNRLHVLTRSDCTTRNQRKAARLAAAYDALEARIARLSEEEELAAVRPDLDGNDIMQILGLPPGPDVGRAYRHMLEIRLDKGPLEPDAARAELMTWARAAGLAPPPAE
ncbi:MAG: poly(A) polymerase [Frankiaceae bacterium]|nr:poly(A) polymerase [Frankiaceae bacterium]